MAGTAWAVVLAVAAAAAYASGVVVQQRAATAPGPGIGARSSLGQVLRSPLWLFGVLLDTAGFGLEFLALRAGSLTLVQPLLVSGLLFALTLGAALTGLRVGLRDAGAAALVVVGLVVAVLVAAPTPGAGGVSPRVWLLTVAVVTIVVAGLALVATMSSGPVARTVCFAGAAAVVNGLLGAFGKAVAIRSEHGWVTALVGWPALGLVVTGALTLSLAAAAFRAGAPTAAIGLLFAGEPAAGVVMAAVLHGDSIRHGPLATTVLATSLLLCLSGVALLARSPAVLASYAAAPPDGRAPDNDGRCRGRCCDVVPVASSGIQPACWSPALTSAWWTMRSIIATATTRPSFQTPPAHNPTPVPRTGPPLLRRHSPLSSPTCTSPLHHGDGEPCTRERPGPPHSAEVDPTPARCATTGLQRHLR